MAKKSAQGRSTTTRSSAARKNVADEEGQTGTVPTERTMHQREAAAYEGVEPYTDGQTQTERNALLNARRREAAKRVEKPGPLSDIAAPGKVHQPVKESGAGTPSADARPGRSSFTGPLDVDIADAGVALAARQKSRIKVQATQTGYYDNIRRRPGEVFFIHADGTTIIDVDENGKRKSRPSTAEDAFSPRWMRRVADSTKLTGTKGPNQIIRERHDEIIGRSPSAARTADDEEDVTDEDENPLDAD